MRAPPYTIRIGGRRIERPISLSLRFALRELADSFEVSVADRFQVFEGERVEVAIAGRTVLVGHVMTSRLHKAPGSRDFTISGFSSAQALVKSSAVLPQRTYSDLSLRKLVNLVAEPFGLDVTVAESALEIVEEPIRLVKIKPSETAYGLLKRVAKKQGCILVSGSAAGRDGASGEVISISRVSTARAAVELRSPSPRVMSLDWEIDVRDMHSHYFVTRRGGGVLADDGTLEGKEGVARDERLPYSPTVLQAESGAKSEAELNRQAEWEMRRRAAEGHRITLTVQGWSPSNGAELWFPNTIYRVVDDDEGLDEDLLVASSEIVLDGQGAIARLEMMPADAYEIFDELTIKQERDRRKARRRPKEEPAAVQRYAIRMVTAERPPPKERRYKVPYIRDEIVIPPKDPNA